jgi:hypothetical protein
MATETKYTDTAKQDNFFIAERLRILNIPKAFVFKTEYYVVNEAGIIIFSVIF